MNQPSQPGQNVNRANFPVRWSGLYWSGVHGIGRRVRARGVALCWLTGAALACLASGLAYLALGIVPQERFASWLAGLGRPETLGALLAVAVGMATWMAPNRNWAQKSEDIAPPPPQDRLRDQPLPDRLGRGVVEASERRQQHLRQSLEIGLVRQLTGVSVLAGRLEQRLSAQARPEAAEVARLRELVERTISEARLLAAAAHPSEIETEGLEAALRKMAGAAEKYHVYCRVVEDSCCLPPDAASALQLYRVVQILVERAIRRGEPHHILVELAAGPEKYMSMTVTGRVGHGAEFPPLTASELGDLQARVRSIGAALQVEHPAGGLRLTCRLIAKGPKFQA